jgi:YfiH family protein
MSERDVAMAPLRSALLELLPGVRHAVTRRVPGLGRADGNVAFSRPRDREDAWAMRRYWCMAAGFDADCLVTLGQVHGNAVHVATAAHAGWGATPGSSQIGVGDALVTNEAGPVLMTLHADCQPLLLVDPGTGRRAPVVAVVHAGWRGTVANIVGRTIETMAQAFDACPADVHVFLGPAIGVCCYDVGDDVAAAWRDRAGSDAEDALPPCGDRYRFSLTAANMLLLERAGVLPAHIDASGICTRCDGEHWFSHRGQGAETGRFGAMIALRSAL